VERRDAQAIADMVALDMARQLDGTTHSVLKNRDVWRSGISESISRNLNTSPIPIIAKPAPGDVVIVSHPPFTVEVSDGILDAVGGFTPALGNEVPNAVKVTVQSSVDYAFMPGTGRVSRTAVAASEGGACFSIGSYAAALDTTTSPLLGSLLDALGTSASLTALDYQALASVDADLLALLQADVGAVTLAEAIAGDRLVSLGGEDGFLVGVANALEGGSGATAAVSVLEALSVVVPGLQVRVADVLNVDTAGAFGLDADLNAFDLVTAAVAAASAANGVSLDNVGVDLGPLLDVTTSTTIIEPPAQGCGRKNSPEAAAQSSAVRLELDSPVADVSVPGLLDTSLGVRGVVEVASAGGQLTDVTCGPEKITVNVSDGLLKVDLNLDLHTDLDLLGIPLLEVSGDVGVHGETDSNGQAILLLDSDDDYDNPVRVENDTSGLPTLSLDLRDLTVTVFGILDVPLSELLATDITDTLFTTIVNPLIQALDTTVLTPLFDSLGLDVSGADVFAARTPTCDVPRLRG
jgi:uncharacterized membrane protein